MKVLVLYADSGHGHRTAAGYVHGALAGRTGVESVCRNALDFTSARWRRWTPGLYRWMVSRRPGLWGAVFGLCESPGAQAALRAGRRLLNAVRARGLEELLLCEKPDAVVTTHFFPAEVAAAMRRRGRLDAVVVSLVTDFFPHRIWLQVGVDVYSVASAQTAAELCARGVEEGRVRATGIPVAERFWDCRAQAGVLRARLGLDPEAFTALVSFGGDAVGGVEELVAALGRSWPRPVQILVVCGENRELHTRLSRLRPAVKTALFGRVEKMEELLGAADLVFVKGGALTLCECAAAGRPAVILGSVPGQEEYNARFAAGRGAALARDAAQAAQMFGAALEGRGPGRPAQDFVCRAGEFADFVLSAAQQHR